MMVPVSAHPGQSVSSLSFSPTARHSLLAASWDCSVRVYDTTPCPTPAAGAAGAAAEPQGFRCNAQHVLPAPVLDVCHDAQGHVAYTGGLDKSVHAISLTDGGGRRVLGPQAHVEAVSAVAFNAAHQCLFSGSWDGSVCVFDPRQATALQARLELQSAQVYSLATAANTLVAATGGKRLLLFDARYMSAPMETRPSPLKTQLRSVAMRPDGECFAVGSTEGRVAVEYVEAGNAEAQSRKYAFKCHRQGDVAFPVNAVAFNPNPASHSVFATGGSDGCVSVWLGERRKRQQSLPVLPVPVAALAYNSDGSQLAIASSHTFEGSQPGDALLNNLYIRSM